MNQDNRTSTTFNTDNRTAVATLTQDNKSSKFLWSVLTFPWQEPAPWLIAGVVNQITQDIRT